MMVCFVSWIFLSVLLKKEHDSSLESGFTSDKNQNKCKHELVMEVTCTQPLTALSHRTELFKLNGSLSNFAIKA